MTLLVIIAASLVVSTVALIGILSVFLRQSSQVRYASTAVSFAAGVMLSAAFLDILPEALELHDSPLIFTAIFAGILLFFFLERFVLWFHHHHEGHGAKPSAVLILVGDAVHNVIDGIAIAAAFLASPAVGVTTTLAIAAHEIPQEIADYSILVAGGMSRRRALAWNFLSALTSVIGAVVGYFFLSTVENWLWFFLAFAGGMFLYIALSDLIPELHHDFRRDRRWQQLVPFVLGLTVFWMLTRLIAE